MDNAKKIQMLEALDSVGIEVKSFQETSGPYPSPNGMPGLSTVITVTLALKPVPASA